MTLEEQNLIAGVFDRIRAEPPGTRDIDASRFIQQTLDRMPDAPYSLVRSVLIQQQALQQLTERLHHLEAQYGSGQPVSSAWGGGDSFLSRGRSTTDAPAGSVPNVSSAPTPAAPEAVRAADNRPAEAPQSRVGGFLASALTTATGVAGGMLLTDGLREMFGGHASGGGSGWGSSSRTTDYDRWQDDLQDARNDAAQARRQLADDDAALDEMQDAADTDDADISEA